MRTGRRERGGCWLWTAHLHRQIMASGAALVLAAIFMALLPVAAFGHGGPEGCYSCHTLDAGEGQINTSFINSASRTMTQIKSAWAAKGKPNGFDVPDRLGCVYCHNNPLNATMKDVASHFGNKASKHPVGKTFAGADSQNEYLSTILGVNGALQTTELDCIDCHNPTALDVDGTVDSYFIHETAGSGSRLANPYMLRDVVAAEQYDAHCRACHGSTANYAAKAAIGTNYRVRIHGDASDGTTNAIKENDNTLMATSTGGDQCRKCHDTHYSNNERLFNDGHENGDTPIEQTDCTTVCHFDGDQYGNFTLHGHGKAVGESGGSMDFDCINCHNAGTEHAGTSSNYKTKYRLNYFVDTASDVTSFGNPKYSVCKMCHGAMPLHMGDQNKGGTFVAGCTDCHDEHAEGSGTSSNIYMIPQKSKPSGSWQGAPAITKAGTETVWYETKNDYYTSAAGRAGQGVCDQMECHGDGTVRGFGSIANMLTTTHTAGTKPLGSDCMTSCHPHESNPGGAFDGGASCVACHGAPPAANSAYASYSSFNEANTPHSLHSKPVASGGYAMACTNCHVKNADTATHDVSPRSYQSVWFNTLYNPGAAAYSTPAVTPDYNQSSNICYNLYCHSNGSASTSKGSVQWMTGTATPDWSTQNLACTACHNNGAGQPYPADAQGTHARHMGRTGIDCQNCHYNSTHDGSTIYLSTKAHVNMSKDVAAGGSFNGTTVAFTFTQGTDNCSNITCHGGYKNITWGTAHSNSCDGCHGSFKSAGGMVTTVIAKHKNADWGDPKSDLSATRFDLSHATGTVDASTGEEKCAYCHANDVAAYTTAKHIDGLIQFNAYMSYNTASFGCANACHPAAAPYVMSDSTYSFENISGTNMSCFSCHGNGTNAYWPDTVSSAAAPDRAGRHPVHLTRMAAKLNYTSPYSDAQQKTMCAYCHENYNTAAWSAHNNGVNNVTGYVDALWQTIQTTNEKLDADATFRDVVGQYGCANFDCHNKKDTGDGAYGGNNFAWYGTATSACTMCHTSGGAASYIVDPTGGLHDPSPAPRITGVAHDELFGPANSTCNACHTAQTITATSTHMTNGTLTADTTNNTSADFLVTLTGYVDSTASCAGTSVNTSCHDGAGDKGTWARVWSTTAYNSNGTECANCHGGFGANDWTFGKGAHNTTDGSVEHQYSWDGDTGSEIIGNHLGNTGYLDKCNLCHVYANAGYTTNAGNSIGWVGNGTNNSTYHGDQSLTMNSHSTVRYNSTNFGCDSGTCHGAGTSSYHLEDSGWNVRLMTVGPAGTCFTCHGNSAGNGTYWPDTANYTSSPDRAGRHLLHITKMATALNYTSPYTDTQQKTLCAYCHENPATAAFGAVHNNTVNNVTGYVDALWQTIQTTNEALDADATFRDAVNQYGCANFDCHNRKDTGDGATGGANYAWYGTSTSACMMCHTAGGSASYVVDPTGGLHENTPLPRITGVAHDDAFGVAATCATCHTAPVLSGTSLHMRNGTMPADTGANTSADFYVTLTGYADASSSCAGTSVNTGCHDGAGDKGTWARVWSTTAYNSNGNECANCHGGLGANDWTFGKGTHNTTDGSVEHQYDWNGDATSDVIGKHNGSTDQFDKCNLCHVYQFTGYSTNGVASIGWVGNGSNNSTYHGDQSIDMNSHSTVRYNSLNYGCDSGGCHGTGATSFHLEDSGLTVRIWTNGPMGGCSSCHGDGNASTYWPDTANYTTTPDRAGRHLVHITKIAAARGYTSPYDGTVQKEICSYCHVNPDGANFGVHNNGVNDVTGYFDALWQTIQTTNEKQDADGTFRDVAGQYGCANVDCHNRKDTGNGVAGSASFAWYGTATTACIMCHTAGGSASYVADPTGGLHDNAPSGPTVTGVAHDDSFGPGNSTCTFCHTPPAMTGTSTHMRNGTMPTDTTNNATADFYMNLAGFVDSASSCAGTAVNTNCHDGAGDRGTWARLWSTTAYNSNGTECANCHGGLGANDWTFGKGTHNTTDGNVEHAYSWDGDASSEVVGYHDGNTDQTDKCSTCHVYPDAPYSTNAGTRIGWVGNASNNSTYHGNQSITMNNTMGYNRTGTVNYGCSTTCHSANASHGLEISTWPVQMVSGPALSCVSCHKGSGSGALKVGSASPHTKVGTKAAFSGTQFQGCEKCHPGGTNTHLKNAVAKTVAIPNLSSVGINYTHTVDTGVTGFVLGGDATGTYTTQAEICWNCHYNTATYQSSAISEWDVNNNANTGASTYNYGKLNQFNWNGATWSSGTAAFTYKNGLVKSTHAANPTSGVSTVSGTAYSIGGMSETLDAVVNIRCAYCHDVHDINAARGNGYTDAVSGAPYLRGTWLGQKYLEDGAPMASSTYTATLSLYGAVPRGATQYTQTGGYYIDQNTTGRTWSASTLNQVAGLCVLCHGSVVNTMDWTTGETLWIGTATTHNGHANSSIGGTGTAAGATVYTNIFDFSHGRVVAATGTATTAFASLVPTQGWAGNSTQGCGYGYRGADSLQYNGSYVPATNAAARAYAWKSYNWGATVNGTLVQSKYHNFPCSKCHNPHASRLPKLLITNCLDVRHNTWDDNKSTQSKYSRTTRTDRNQQTAYFDSAINCHRVTPAQSTKRPGWTRVAPW